MHIKSVSLYLPRNEWNIGSRKFHPRKPGHGRGSAPYGHWLDQPPVGNVQTGQFKTTRLRAARSLVTLFLFKRNSLSNVAGTPRTARWTLALRSAEANYTRIKDCVKRRNIAELRIKQPPTQLSPWRHTAVSSLHTRATEEARTDHVTNVTKNRRSTLNSRGKTKPKQQPA